jgi:hypothetical protein
MTLTHLPADADALRDTLVTTGRVQLTVAGQQVRAARYELITVTRTGISRYPGRFTRQTRLLPGCGTCGEPIPRPLSKVEAAVDVLAELGPTLGRPLVDTLAGSKLANLKELRPRQANIRVLFAFGPWRSCMSMRSPGQSNCTRSTWRNEEKRRGKASDQLL